jgi:hypothetical protein
MPTPEEQVATMKQNLEAKTGVSWKTWLERAATSGEAKHGAIVKHLKTEYGLTHGYANLVAIEYRQSAEPSDGGASGVGGADDLVATQYAGKKEALRPIHDALVAAVESFGEDVEFAPKKTYVSLRRRKQFGLIQPSTATRVDVGLNLKGRAPEGRLEAAGSWNGMVSHRVRLSTVEEVDAALIGWLREAYEES